MSRKANIHVHPFIAVIFDSGRGMAHPAVKGCLGLIVAGGLFAGCSRINRDNNRLNSALARGSRMWLPTPCVARAATSRAQRPTRNAARGSMSSALGWTREATRSAIKFPDPRGKAKAISPFRPPGPPDEPGARPGPSPVPTIARFVPVTPGSSNRRRPIPTTKPAKTRCAPNQEPFAPQLDARWRAKCKNPGNTAQTPQAI